MVWRICVIVTEQSHKRRRLAPSHAELVKLVKACWTKSLYRFRQEFFLGPVFFLDFNQGIFSFLFLSIQDTQN